MTSSRTHLLVIISALGATGLSSSAYAEGQAQAAQIAYSSVSGCPSESDFLSRVQARGGSLSTPRDPGLRRFEVQASAEQGRFVGTLRIVRESSNSNSRRVEGTTCSEVVDALAIVAAIELGKSSESAVPQQGDPSTPKDAEQSTPNDAPATVQAAQRESVAAPRPSPQSQGPDTKRQGLSGSSLRRVDQMTIEGGTLHFDKARAYNLTAGAEFGWIPNQVVPRLDLSTTVANFVTPPNAKSLLFGPVLQAHWNWYGPTTNSGSAYDTRLIGMSAGISPCAAFTYDSRGFTAMLCGNFTAGLLWHKTTDKVSRQGTWTETSMATAGAALEGQYNLGSLFQLTARMGFDSHFGRVAPTDPQNRELFRAGIISGYALGGLGIHFD